MYTYNTTLPSVRLRSYGRHIQQLLDQIRLTPDREKRTSLAHSVIGLMRKTGSNTQTKSEHDMQLWADLCIMADGDLDIDMPYPMPTQADTKWSVNKVAYPKKVDYFRSYGRYLSTFIQEVSKKLGNEAAEDEKIAMLLIRCVHNFHKRENLQSIVAHIEKIITKKGSLPQSSKRLSKKMIEITPTLTKWFSRKTYDRKKRDYSTVRNERKN